MAYRCQSCGHFASLDDPELDSNCEEFDGETFSVSVSATYPSACCGDEVGTAEYEVSEAIEFSHKTDCKDPDEATYNVSVDSCEATDRFQDKDRHGKPITSSRYQRHYYGVEVAATITCNSCGAEEEVNGSDESGPPEEAY